MMYSEEALTDKLFQVPPNIFAVDGFVPFAVMEGTLLFCSE